MSVPVLLAPAYEAVIVTGVGEGVTSPQVGQRVAVPWLGYACGTCKYCLTGWETLCLAQQNTGYSVDGCYAEYFLAEAAFATPVPAGLAERMRRRSQVSAIAPIMPAISAPAAIARSTTSERSRWPGSDWLGAAWWTVLGLAGGTAGAVTGGADGAGAG